MRVRVIIETPDWQRDKVFELPKKLTPILLQEVSGHVVGVVVEERKDERG